MPVEDRRFPIIRGIALLIYPIVAFSSIAGGLVEDDTSMRSCSRVCIQFATYFSFPQSPRKDRYQSPTCRLYYLVICEFLVVPCTKQYLKWWVHSAS